MLKKFSIVAAPGSTEVGSLADAIQSQLIAHAEAAGSYRFVVLDMPMNKSVFPFVGHGNDVGGVEMLPLGFATVLAFVGWWRATRVPALASNAI